MLLPFSFKVGLPTQSPFPQLLTRSSSTVLGGSQITSDNPNTIKNAFMIMKIGVGLQVVCFGLFLIIAVRFHFVARTFRQYWPDERWTKFLWAINVACVLIFVSIPEYCYLVLTHGYCVEIHRLMVKTPRSVPFTA